MGDSGMLGRSGQIVYRTRSFLDGAWSDVYAGH